MLSHSKNFRVLRKIQQTEGAKAAERVKRGKKSVIERQPEWGGEKDKI